MKKQEARNYGLQNRKKLTESQRADKAHCIYQQLVSKIQKANCVGCYVSFGNEVDTHAIIDLCFALHKRICVPKVCGKYLQFYEIHSWSDLQEGYFHILEPVTKNIVDLHCIDLMIVPLAAFDQQGNRCGYGKGFYDSVLHACQRKVGIAYKEQMVEHIECDPWDVPLDDIYFA